MKKEIAVRASNLLGVNASKLDKALFLAKSESGGMTRVANILGMDESRVKQAFSLARSQDEFREESLDYVSVNERKEKPESKINKNAFGVIDINVIFIRDWLEEKGTSIFGNKFAFFFIILTITIVGGMLVLMLSGVLGDILQTFKWQFSE